MGHPDPDVRLGVASCISEITRITTPDAPYDDDAMRDVFYLIVTSFQHLDDIKDPFFERRVSILDTAAKVRACVVMLDLECDDLINDMSHHFLRTVSSGHSDAVISCMETIMRLVIEESDDVQPQIALCLLQNVAYDDGDVEVLLLRNEKWEFISEEKQASVASETTLRRHKDKRLPSFHPLDLICEAIGRSPQDASVGARAHHVASIGEQQNNMDSLQKMVDFGRESLNCEGEQDVHDESLNVSANDADQQAQTSDEHITKGPMTTSTGGIVKKHKAIAEMPCIKETGSVRPESRSAKANLNKQEADQGKDYSISRCLDVLEAMDDVPDEMTILASDVFRDATNRELFLCYASRLRGPWLKKELEKLHGP